MQVLRRSLWWALRVAFGVCGAIAMGACSKFNAAVSTNQSSLDQNQLVDPLHIERSQLRSFVQNSLSINGQCISNQEVSIAVNSAMVSTTGCVDKSFAATVELVGADGVKTVMASQSDLSGRLWQDSITVTKDTLAPAPTLLNVVREDSRIAANGTCEMGAAISFAGDITAAPSAVQCLNGTFQTLLMPTPGDGQKQIVVRQTDEAGNLGESAKMVMFDTTAPVVTIAQPAENAQFTDAFTLSGSCETGLDVVASGGGVSALVSASCQNGSYTLPASLSAGTGNKQVIVSQTDSSQNRGQAIRNLVRIVANNTPPAIAILQPAANTAAQAGVTISGSCQSGLTVNISGAVSAPSTTACNNGQFSAAISFSAGDGNKTINVAQTNANNLTGTAQRTFVRDSKSPTVTIVSPVANAAVGASVQVSGACETGIPVVLYGGGVNANVSANCTNGLYSGMVTLKVGDGAKEIRAGQTDLAQNSGVAMVQVVLDTTAPVVQILQPLAGTIAPAGLTVTGSCESGLAVSAGGSGVASMVQAACANNSFSVNVVFSSGDGNKNIVISQTDGVGNKGQVSRDFTKGELITTGATLYATHCASCHGALASSTKLNKTALQIKTAINTVGAMSSNPGLVALTAPQIDAIAAALKTAPTLDVANPFTCQPGTDPAVAPLKRLTYREYVNTLLDLMAGQLTQADVQNQLGFLTKEAVVDHPAVRLYDTTNQVLMSPELLAAYNNIGAKAADVITASAAKMNALNGNNNCISQATVNDTCVNGFLDIFGRRAARRPLSATEKTAYLTLYRTGTSSADSLARVIQALLSSPQFLYHLNDNGTAVAGRTDLFQLSAYELASKISYLVIGSMPDETLFTAAANGSLNSAAGIQTQVDRLFQTARARTHIRDFYSQWFRLDKIPVMAVSTAFANGIDPEQFPVEARQEIVDFMDDVIWTKKGNYQTLFTSNMIFPKGPNLARAYGVNQSASGVASSDPNRIGLLTRAGILSQSPAGGTDPIKRGVRVRINLLCDNLGSPPANAVSMGATIDPLTSTRTQTTVMTSPAACVSCHSKINPSGFAFEHFDAFGRYRLQETVTHMGQQATWPIDAKVFPNIASDNEPMVNGAVEMQNAILKSYKAPACAAQQFLHFNEGRLATANDACSLAPMYDALTKSGGSFQDMFKVLPQTPNFKLKKIN